jgi:hypothetical protein
MTMNVQVSCDGCGKDLTTTSNAVDYRLALSSESIPFSGQVATTMMVYVPVHRTRHFCGVGCLKKWMLVLEDPAKYCIWENCCDEVVPGTQHCEEHKIK